MMIDFDRPGGGPPWVPPIIMGIVNITPDSFFDGGAYNEPQQAIDHALRLADEGADIVDIGGESTRPPGRDYAEGSRALPVDEEIERVLPVVAAVARMRPELCISIDTMKPQVARRAIDAGARMINDVSGGAFDKDIWQIAAEENLPYILMHGHDPANRRPVEEHRYTDVVEEVWNDLNLRVTAARNAGVKRIIGDVGIGFAKGAADSIRLLQEHRRFLALGVPMLVGASRKSFIGRMLGGAPASERLYGSIGAHAAAAIHGASIIRTHDVAETRQALDVLFMILGGRT